MHFKLVDKLMSGALLLTPTRRLAAACLKDFDASMQESQMQAWEMPKIQGLQDWCIQYWQYLEVSGYTDCYLMTAQESLLLMEEIIQKSSYADRLLKPHTTAKLVLSAWNTLHYWCESKQIEASCENVDQEAFQDFCKHYRHHLLQFKLIDQAQLLDRIMQHYCENVTHAFHIHHLICYGFDDITPQFSKFLKLIESKSCILEIDSPTAIVPDYISRIACEDVQDEIKRAAVWAKEKLLSKNPKEKTLKIGIVLPNLPAYREQVVQAFDAVFDAESQISPITRVSPEYNISTAIPLTQYPCIQICFSLLRMLKFEFSVSDLSHVLNSAYIKDSIKHQDLYQTIKSKVIDSYQDKLTLEQWISVCQKYSDADALLEIIISLKSLTTYQKTQKISNWSRYFEKVLNLWDWPGERALNSIEHQAVNRFYKFLDEFCQLDKVFGNVGYSDALDKFQKFASNIAFQPENQGAPIQILGILEASGLIFDELWLMNLHHENWPPKAEPNPFLPLALQKQAFMPHASPQREYEFSKKITDKLLTSATHIICSYPLLHDNNPVYPSELINHLTMAEPYAIQRSTQRLEQISNHVENIEYIDHYFQSIPLSLDAQSKESIKGGSQIFEYQAQCPFKAFAKFRLKANNSEPQTLGINPKIRGIIIHECLQKFWEQVKTQQALIALSDNLAPFLEGIISEVITIQKRKVSYTEVLWQLEKMRIKGMLLDIMAIEKTRPSFQISAVESFHSIQVGELHINIRIDRIDALENNQYLLIDYKTSNMHIKNIVDVPLRSPQLPLYLMSEHAFVSDGVAWFVVGKEENGLLGISAQDLDITGIVPVSELNISTTWESQLQVWHNELNRLSQAYIDGYLTLNPIDGVQTCRLCDLGSFCRIQDKMQAEKMYG
ncbi:MAG: PD-(D/E)XK nuclease family protein [Candidatus Berkiella sp.]